MNRTLRFALLIGLYITFGNLSAQNVLYRDTFTNGVTYCQTDKQWKGWQTFRAKLDTTTKFFTEVKMNGQFASNARTCADKTVVRRLAEALRTGSAYVGYCNSYYWEVSSSGSCMSSGCSGASSSEVVHFGCYPTSAGVCSCSGDPYWVFRHTIRNSNWGGIGTSTTCGANTQWMELEFKAIPPHNYELTTLSLENISICTSTQDIKANFINTGKKNVDSFEYTVKVNSTVYGPYKFKGSFPTQTAKQLTVLSSFSFTPNTNYAISVWAKKPNNTLDSFALNDTAKATILFRGTKSIPNAIDTSVCGSQATTLRAIPGSPGDSLAWFADRNVSQFLARGNKYKTKFLASGNTYKFYVSSYNGYVLNNLNAGYTLTNAWPGTMFDLQALSSDLTVDSFGLNLYSFYNPVGTSQPVEVYIREGSYLDPGAINTASMWTLVYKGNVISRGSQVKTHCPVTFEMKAGKTYGVYINPTNGQAQNTLVKPMNTSYTDADMRLSGGTLNQPNFGTYLTNYTFDGQIFYKKFLCKSAPDSATLIVNPTPYGARLEPGTPFQTSPKKSGSGTSTAPHVVALGDVLTFNLRHPSQHNDGNHGTNWKVASVTMVSKGGRSLSSFTWTDPVSSSNTPGKLSYSPTSTEIDSVVMVRVRIQEIGGNNCDTFLTHYIYVAPLPQPDFKRASKICDGDPVEFTNTSDIESGFLEYRWYFGTGDSSDAQDPIYQYPTFGTYYCKLNAISSIYGYVRSKIDTIVVTQIPNVAFTVQNACETQTHQFTNKSTVSGGTLVYSWNFGDNTALSSAKDPSHKYANAGQYKVTLTATANGCASALTKNAYLFPKPVASFTFPTGSKYCTNTPVTFKNTSTISSGNLGARWTFENGQFGTVNSPTHVFDLPGSYTVKLTAISEFGCIDSAKKPLTIFEAPVVKFTNGQVCDQTPTEFTNNTDAVPGAFATYSWSFGDGAKSTAQSPSHQYSLLGPKTVKLVVSLDNGCKDSAMANIIVGTQAVVDFDVANTCSGQAVQFENKTTFKQGSIKYDWDFGGIGSSILADPLYTFNVTKSTQYNVTLTAVTDGGCEATITKSLTVFELPVCGFTIKDDWTPGDGYRTVYVEAADLTYPFYRFKFSDGGSIDASSGKYQFPYEGDFTITMIARNQVDCECQLTQAKSIRNSTGTNTINTQDIRLFPNPSSGTVNVQASTAINSIAVFNVLGEAVSVKTSTTGANSVIEFGEVVSGIYLVKVTTAHGTVTQRLSLQK